MKETARVLLGGLGLRWCARKEFFASGKDAKGGYLAAATVMERVRKSCKEEETARTSGGVPANEAGAAAKQRLPLFRTRPSPSRSFKRVRTLAWASWLHVHIVGESPSALRPFHPSPFLAGERMLVAAVEEEDLCPGLAS